MVLLNPNKISRLERFSFRPSETSDKIARNLPLSRIVRGALVASFFCLIQSASATDYTSPAIANGGPLTPPLFPGDTVTTTADNTPAVHAFAGGTANFGGPSAPIGLTTSGFNSPALFAENPSTSVTVQNLNILTTGGGSDDLRVFAGATFTGSNLTLTATGVDGSGLYGATNFGAAFFGSANPNPIIKLSNTTIKTSGVRGFGLELDHATGVQIANVTVTTTGNGAAGIEAYDLAGVTVTGSHFTTSGGLDTTNPIPPYPYAGASGVVVSDSTVTMTDSTVLTTGVASHGVYVLNLTATNAKFTGTNVAIETDGANAAGLAVQNGGIALLTSSQIVAKGVNSYGILAIGSTPSATEVVNLNNTSVTTAQADAIHVVGPDATITATNGSSITGGNGVLFHVVSAGNVVGTASLVADGNVTLVGDVIADPGSVANVALRNSTVLTGSIQNGGAIENSNSTWNMTASSTMVSLLVSNGRINFAPPSAGVFKTLTAGSLSGNSGIFGMNVNVAALKGDLLNITGASAGGHLLAITNQGGSPSDITQALRVVHTGDGVATFGLTTKFVEVGAFNYSLFRGNGSAHLPQSTDWYLAAAIPVTPGAPVTPPVLRISDTTNAIIGTFAASTLTWYDDLGTLVQRMGELRYDREQVTHEEPVNTADGKGVAVPSGKTIAVNQEVPDNSGVWLRGIGNSIDIDNGVARSFTQETGGFQIGLDHRFSVPGGDLYLGAFGGYLYTSRDFGNDSGGHTDSLSIGTYATYIRPDGWYADLVGKFTYMWNELNARSINFGRASGEYDIPTIGGSLEIGKRFDLPCHIFLEPQAQIAGVWADSANYRTTSGLFVNAGDQGSLRGRLGLRIGTHVKVNETVAIEPYVVGSVIHEFLTGDVVTVDNFAFVNTLSGTAGQVGVGATAKLNQHARVYAEYDYLNGDHIEEPWAVSVGFRWAW